MPVKGASPGKKTSRPKPEAHELAEMWRCAASLERLAPEHKEALGDAMLKDRTPPPGWATALWCFGRLGARVPLYGLANTAVRREVAERWINALLAQEFSAGRETLEAIFALSQLARVANDRARDIDDELRARVLARLSALGADESVLLPVPSTTNSNPPRSSRPSATPCRSACD